MLTQEQLLEQGITPETLNQMPEMIRTGKERYGVDESLGVEGGYFNAALKGFPENTKHAIIAMKVALIDMTNSTNLSRLTGYKKYKQRGKWVERNVFTVAQLIEQIVTIPDFDERIKRGDTSVVDKLTRWSDEHGANMMSFFSKYCLYHNHNIYNGDAYSIYDSVVKKNLGRYLTNDEFAQVLPGCKLRPKFVNKKTGQAIPEAKAWEDARASAMATVIDKMKTTCNYSAYVDLIGKILEIKGITPEKVKFPRRYLDLYVWYLNRTERDD